MEKLLITLRFYGSGCLQTSVSDFFCISQSKASRVIYETTIAICMLKNDWIRWLESPEIVMENFYNMAHFPCCIGCIDCTHIRIRRPTAENADDFINRKGFHSINV